MMTAEREGKRGKKREGERERESRLDLAVRQLERIACAMVRTSASSDEGGTEREGEKKRRVRERVPCIIHVQRSLVSDGGPVKQKAFSLFFQCENELGYRLRATERAMRFIKSLRGTTFSHIFSSELYNNKII